MRLKGKTKGETMIVTITIDTNSAAFDGFGGGPEVERILGVLSNDIMDHGLLRVGSTITLVDHRNNVCGEFKVTESEGSDVT